MLCSYQVNEALEIVGRLVGVAPLVPELVERLHALKELHERAAQFAGSVAYISQSQDQLTRETKELKSLLAQVMPSRPACILFSTYIHMYEVASLATPTFVRGSFLHSQHYYSTPPIPQVDHTLSMDHTL